MDEEVKRDHKNLIIGVIAVAVVVIVLFIPIIPVEVVYSARAMLTNFRFGKI